MLRNRPSRVTLGMADVNQTKQRLKLKQTSHPLVAQTDWAYAHIQHHSTNQPAQPHYRFRQGPQRSRDASLVQLDPNRHVPQFAVYESTDSAEDSDSSQTIPHIARLVHIAEVSPTITEVPSYDPPALLDISPRRRLTHDDYQPGPIAHHHRHPGASLEPDTYRYDDALESDLNHRSDFWYQHSRRITNHPHQRHNNPRTTPLSQRGHNPAAIPFAPRVHFGSPLEELPPHHRSNMASVYRRGGSIRPRAPTGRNPSYGRGDMNYQARPRPISRSRASMMYGRSSVRSARRPGGHVRLPAASSIDAVMDRYPVFPSMLAQAQAKRPDRPSSARTGNLVNGRGIIKPPTELGTAHMLPSQSRLSSTTESLPSVRSRASNSSFSTPDLFAALRGHPTRSHVGSRSWEERLSPQLSSARTSRAGSWTSSLLGSRSDEYLDHQRAGLPPPCSPLDRLTQELRRLSTSLPSQSQSSLGCTSRVTSTDGRLLDVDTFYAGSDEEIVERDTRIYDRPGRRNSSHIDGYYSTDGQDTKSSREPRRHVGIAARIADVEADCQSGLSRLLPLSPSTQSASSIPGFDAAMLDSFPPNNLPSRVPITPARQLASCPRSPYTSRTVLRSHAIARVKVYDDGQPPSTQPQTPTDLHHRFRTHLPTESMAVSCHTERMLAKAPVMDQSPVAVSHNVKRNTYPSSQQGPSQPRDTSSQSSSPYSPNLDLRTAAAISAVERRRTARVISNENVIDPSTNGMEAEREAFLRRGAADGTDTLDCTPPHEGRYEKYISR
ncbi:hypothetical protein AUEXF2481DRAFT_85269 [Aureobasidium subglaciale EXF-2481]|uniref:Uncharacterized protein n=1 Tax=Aureobasidium subglaciale (strain EXF-2481) TaxID=1043005 RepID=A0A074ZMU6_AURSE|nr:uncharacterized protein AUEXF2481DRAFT_85269 [Aureobasidium subglaciale EXF-2481]KEQ99691.1 hypothetical protein AUEXF2481DRAFT_85269 [Aureobasidium subglaciale EXF-2481]